MSSQRHAPAALIPRNPLVQIEYEAGLQSRFGQFAEETNFRRCRDSNSGSEIGRCHRGDHEYSGLLDTSHIRRQSTEVVGILELTKLRLLYLVSYCAGTVKSTVHCLSSERRQ